MKIQMCDLAGQYNKIKHEVDEAMLQVISASTFIYGPQVKEFKANLEQYTGAKHVIPCATAPTLCRFRLWR